jgi:hypothetical protein
VREALKFIIYNKWKTLDITYNKLTLLISRGWDTHVLRDIVGGSTAMQYIMLYGYLPVAALGFIGLARLYDRRNRIIAITTGIYLLCSVLLAIFKFRYRLLAEPMLIMYASLLIGSIWETAQPRRANGRA